MDGDAGVTAIAVNAAGATVNVVPPLMLPADAVMVVVPAVIDVARPRLPALLLTTATPASDEVHVTIWVRSAVVLLL